MLIAIPYKDVDFVWVSNHWDFHREGICRYNGELAQFSCTEVYPEGYGSCGEDCEGCPQCDYEICCWIMPLTWRQKLRWIWMKKLFEICVGYHWAYPQRREGVMYGARRPRRFWGFVSWLYYRPWVMRLRGVRR
jgi:hypothetical protein